MTTPKPAKPKPSIVKKPWQNGLGPYYIGLCLWLVYFDRIGSRALPVGGVGWSCLGVLLAGPLCYLLLYRVPALWGHATGKSLTELAEGTFGRAGARWVPGLLVAIGAVAWFAVSVSFATDLTIRGLEESGLYDGRAHRPIVVGGLTILGPVYLATSLFWSVAAALVGRWLVRLIAAIMYVFPIFPAIILGATMLAMLGGLRTFAPTGIDPTTGVVHPPGQAGLWSMMLVIQMILGFFAMAGATAADWGAATTTERDVRVGGWVGACVAPVVIATLALLTVAGYQGKLDAPAYGDDGQGATDAIRDPIGARNRASLAASVSEIRTVGRDSAPSYRAVLTDGIGGRLGCAMLLICGVAALAPAVYSSYVFGQRFHATFPALSKTRWTLIGMLMTVPLVVTGLADRLEAVFTIMGAVFAPVVACMAADFKRQRGAWPGPRGGVNLPGLIAWGLGLAVGLLPILPLRGDAPQPATFWAFLVAFAAYTILAGLGAESKPVPPPATVPEAEPATA